MNPQVLPELVKRLSLVVAPLLVLLSVVAMPTAASSARDQILSIEVHPDRWYAFALLSLVSSALLVPALLELMALGRARAPFGAIVGAGLCCVGAFVAVADSATQLVYWQMGTGDRAAMLALAHRYEHAFGAGAIFMVGGLSLLVGSMLLGVALARARAVPMWAAAAVPIGIVANLVGFAAGSRFLLVASGVVLLAGFGRAALRAPTATPAVASAV